MKLDPIDLRILAEVQRDGRITKVALAERVGLSATPCWNRLRRLEDAGIISGYHAHVAARAVVSITLIFVEIKLAGHRKPDFDRRSSPAGRPAAASTTCSASSPAT